MIRGQSIDPNLRNGDDIGRLDVSLVACTFNSLGQGKNYCLATFFECEIERRLDCSVTPIDVFCFHHASGDCSLRSIHHEVGEYHQAVGQLTSSMTLTGSVSCLLSTRLAINLPKMRSAHSARRWSVSFTVVAFRR